MKQPSILLLLSLSAVVVLSACGSSGFYSNSDSRRDQRSANVKDPLNENHPDRAVYDIKFKGTVVYYKSHGGHYMISSDDGVAYHPIDLPSSYREAGTRVWVRGKVVGSAMHGEARKLDIDEIRRR